MYNNIRIHFRLRDTIAKTYIARFTHSKSIPDSKLIAHNMIGPPDVISNLRPVVLRKKTDETAAEKEHREYYEEVQLWNQAFWKSHNTNFFKKKDDYIAKNLQPEKKKLSADEMSVFYKKFLDDNWRLHFTYNGQWYRKNFRLLFLYVKAKLSNTLRLK